MPELQCKKVVYRKGKQSQDTKQKFRNIAWACRDGVSKAKAQLDLRLARDVKSNRKSFYCCISSKRLNKENMGSLLKG